MMANPEGVGKELAEFLTTLEVVNGWRDDGTGQANGVGCLAAQFVKRFKNRCGGLYLYPTNAKGCGEEYLYTVSTDSRLEPTCTILRADSVHPKYDSQYKLVSIEYEKLFEGAPEDYLKWLESEKEEE
jgi:hypothetical protein